MDIEIEIYQPEFWVVFLGFSEFAQQILGFSDEVNGQGPFTSPKSTRGASKLTESEVEKPKTQVIRQILVKSRSEIGLITFEKFIREPKFLRDWIDLN